MVKHSMKWERSKYEISYNYAKQFEVRENQIEYNLVLLEREQRTQKSIEEIRIIHEKFSRIKSNSIPKITKATGHNFSCHNFFLFVFLYREINAVFNDCLLYTSPSPRDGLLSRMPSSA